MGEAATIKALGIIALVAFVLIGDLLFNNYQATERYRVYMGLCLAGHRFANEHGVDFDKAWSDMQRWAREAEATLRNET